MNTNLIGHWKLNGNVNDSSGNGLPAMNHGADLSAPGPDGRCCGAARFSGRGQFIEVNPKPSLRLGTGDFTLAAWIHTERNVDDSIGDILSKYDPDTRTGFNLTVKRMSGVTTSLPNFRNLEFGIDCGRVDKAWADCGRPGNARHIFALCVHDGQLFAGTYEHEGNESGHVYVYAGNGQWTDCGSPDGSNGVMALATFEGQLYAGTARYKARGSALENSANRKEGGKVFRYAGNQEWTDCGKLGGPSNDLIEYQHDGVHGLEVFRGGLYAIPLYTQGLFRYAGGEEWTDLGSPGSRLMAICTYRDRLYCLKNGTGGAYLFDHGPGWTKWSETDTLPGVTQTYSSATYGGKLHVGTWPEGKVFRLEEDGSWRDTGRLGEEKEVMGMAVYNGKLYAGTLPLAQVYRYDGDGEWTLTGQLDKTSDVKYRRAWSAAVFQGKLFFGTLPSGQIFSLEAGRAATHDFGLEPGWRHVTAVRRNDRLLLYLDGKLAAQSSEFNPAEYDLSAGGPLRIGFGAHDYFHGCISDVRIYGQAIRADGVKKLAAGTEE